MSENNQILSSNAQLVGMPLAGPESFSQQQLAYLKRALGVDETVLYDVGSGTPSGTVTLSESPSNFERIGITYYAFDVSNAYNYIELPANQSVFTFGSSWSYSNAAVASFFVRVSLSSLTLTCNRQSYVNFNSPSNVVDATANFKFYKIVGIHRIAGGNT